MLQKNRHMSKKLDMGVLYLRDYSLSLSGREIARRINVNHQTALTVLNELVKEKILLSKAEGRNKKYSFNKKDLRTKLFLQMAETYKAEQFLHNVELRMIISHLLPLAETIIVFGSFAKGIEKESSDLDLILIGAANKEKVNKAKNTFPREINIEFRTWKEFAEALSKKMPLALEIQKDHVVYGNVFNAVEVYCQ